MHKPPYKSDEGYPVGDQEEQQDAAAFEVVANMMAPELAILMVGSVNAIAQDVNPLQAQAFLWAQIAALPAFDFDSTGDNPPPVIGNMLEVVQFGPSSAQDHEDCDGSSMASGEVGVFLEDEA